MTDNFSTPSTEWAIRYYGSATFNAAGFTAAKAFFKLKNILALSPSLEVSIFELKNLTTGDVEQVVVFGLGLAAGFGRASASLIPAFMRFETENAYTFEDFEGLVRAGFLYAGFGPLGVSPINFITFSNIDLKNDQFGEEIDLSGWSAGVGLSLGYFPLAGAVVTENGKLDPALQSAIILDSGTLKKQIENGEQQSENHQFEPQECILPIPQIEGKCTINLTDGDQWNNLLSNIDTANNQAIEWTVPNVFSDSSPKTDFLGQSPHKDGREIFLNQSTDNDDAFLNLEADTCIADHQLDQDDISHDDGMHIQDHDDDDGSPFD